MSEHDGDAQATNLIDTAQENETIYQNHVMDSQDPEAIVVPEKSEEELNEEYKKKAEELENRLDRMEGRIKKEEALAAWFEGMDSDVTVKPILKKGMGMVSRRAVETDKVIMTCPPYVCVPYEPRKMFVCAYCFKEFKYLEERYHQEQAALQTQNSGAEAPPPTTTLSDTLENLKNENNTENNEESGTVEHYHINGSEIEPVQNADDEQVDQMAPVAPPMPETIIDELVNCPGCKQVWYCSQECLELDLPEHSFHECTALAGFDIPWAKDYYSYCDDLITDIRLLIRAMNKRVYQQSQSNNEFYEEYQLLISNVDCYPEDVLASLRSIVQYTNYLLPDPANLPEDELLEVYCKHRVNMFGLWAQGGECLGYGVYPRASYFNHSCWPNTTFYKNPTNKIPHMDFLTVWPIEKEGDEVCISYIDISSGLRERRGTLLDKYFFHCTCERCMLQELSPEEPDPYYIYWAPQNPPIQENMEQPTEDGDLAVDASGITLDPSKQTTNTEDGPFESV